MDWSIAYILSCYGTGVIIGIVGTLAFTKEDKVEP